MLLEELYDYKNQLMEELLTSEEIVHLIDPDLDFEDAKTLAYTHVFPYEYIPQTVQDGKTYVCFDVDVQDLNDNNTFLNAVMYVWVISHRGLLRLPEGGVRPDKICCEINKAINSSMKFGIGRLDLYSVKRFAPMTDYQGKVMTFKMVEFNTVYEKRRDKNISGNRKQQ